MSGSFQIDIDSGYLIGSEIGEGQPIILAHGFSFNQTSWQPQVNVLAKKYRVITYDMRGFGQSSIPHSCYSHADDLRILVEELGLEQPIFMGLSLGGNVVLDYCASYPQNVKALILASTGLVGWTWDGESPPNQTLAYARKYGVEAGKAFWLNQAMFTSLKKNPKALGFVKKMVAAYSGWHWQNENPIVWKNDIVKGLNKISTETLVITGEHEHKGYRDIAFHIADHLPRSELRELVSAGHVCNLEVPIVFNQAVLDFLHKIDIDNHHD